MLEGVLYRFIPLQALAFRGRSALGAFAPVWGLPWTRISAGVSQTCSNQLCMKTKSTQQRRYKKNPSLFKVDSFLFVVN
jgi:hypothetical protein